MKNNKGEKVTKVKPNLMSRESIIVAVFLLISFIIGSLCGILTNGGLLQ